MARWKWLAVDHSDFVRGRNLQGIFAINHRPPLRSVHWHLVRKGTVIKVGRMPFIVRAAFEACLKWIALTPKPGNAASPLREDKPTQFHG